MARHALSKSRRRALLRAGLTVTAVGAALGAGGAAAQAAPLPVVPATGSDSTGLGAATDAAGGAVVGALGQSLDHGIAPVTHLRLDPLAGTGTDPLDNAVGTQVADFKPVSTAQLTDPVTSGGALKDLPLVGQVTGLLHS